jgi:hypothetical protein
MNKDKTLKDKIFTLVYRITPASKLEVFTARYEMKLLIDAIKEIEAVNRADISKILNKIEHMIKEPSSSDSKDKGDMYQ